jgi:diguanylate cyclase (GGDEF)-like protein/PAS domain S-box-containing protein
MKMNLGRRLTVVTMVFAILVSLVLTGIDLSSKYRIELRATNYRLAQIETTTVPSIVDAMWQYNVDSARLIAEGIAKQPDVSHVAISDGKKQLISIGKQVAGAMRREYPLKPPNKYQKGLDNSGLPLGTLTVEIDHPAVEQRLLAESLSNLAYNLFLIVMVTGFVLLLLEFQVMRHIRHVSRFVDSRNSNNLNDTLTLENRQLGQHGNDELAMLVSGVDRMKNSLRSAITQMQDEIQTREAAEASLRIAAIAFESQEGMFITDADKVILRVNPAFSEITGYSAEEAIGKTPHLFSSGRHDAAFYIQIEEDIRQSGKWQGEVWSRRKNGEVYPEWLTITSVKDDAGVVTNYVSTLTDITYRKAAEEEINHLAFYDSLTRLPNRRLLLDRLQLAMASGARSGKYGALLFIDLDNFKTLNDTLGHDIGDLLLQQVAQRLSTCVREGDTVARLGGDEFVVMIEDLSENIQESATQTEIVGEKILATLNQPYQLDSHAYHSTPSIGVTLFDNHVVNIDELLKRADLAMYQAKAAGRNTLRFFDPEMQTAVSNRAALEAGLREALLNNQFLLHYQAQVDHGGNLIGVEVLVRWLSPQRGLVPPLEFIPLAEDTGLILPLGYWVLETACMQLAVWAARPEMAHLTVAVNVSVHQFRQNNFVDQVMEVLARTGVNPRLLKLELTESLLVNDVLDVISKMATLKAVEVSFSLDDFGTGYSSLAYLKRLPLDQLKIDQSFVKNLLTDPNDVAISKMVIALADSIGLAVIAEGVENEAQKNLLERLGCKVYQGYFFSRPLPLNEFEAYAKRVL